VPLVFVEGNAELTLAKLIGHHNPARVLREDHSAAIFIDGRCSRRYEGPTPTLCAISSIDRAMPRLGGGEQSVAAAPRK
jgi:hypothetical protein